MTMLSFRVDSKQASEADAWAHELGIDRSQLLRDALHRQLQRLRAERDAQVLAAQPPDDSLGPLSEVAAWGPAEDWSGWADAAG